MWEEERKELLKQAIEVSLLLPAQTQEEQEEYLCETISELIQLRSTLKYALSKPELQEEFLTTVIHRFLDIFFPILNSPNNIYFKLLELQRHQQVEFFELFFTHYETMFLALREDVKEDYIDKYQKIVNLLSSPFTAERQIWLFIIKELLPIIKRTKHRIKIYQYILNLYITFIHPNNNNNYCDNNNNKKKSNDDVEEDGDDNNKNKESGDEILNGENLKEVLNDIIRLKEYELLKTYVNTFQLSSFLVNYKFQNGSALQEACSVHSLDIIKYLIETVGINYHPPLYVQLSQSLPIVTAVKLSRNNNNNNMNNNNKSQLNNNNYNNSDNSNDEQVGSDDDEEEEEEKRRSREIVEYMVGLYKRDNCFADEFLKQTKRTANHTFNVNDIVQTAYSHANIPVLLYLKEIGFNISEYSEFLSEAVNSSSVEAVKLYWNDYQLSSSSSSSSSCNSTQYDYSFNEIMFEAGMNDKSFEELLSGFEELGINCCSYPILLATGRMEIISRYDFSNYVPKIEIDPISKTPHYNLYHILRCLMTSQYLSSEYLEVLFSRYPIFKFYFDEHRSDVLIPIFQISVQSKYEKKKSIILQNLISIPNLTQIAFEPYLSFWVNRFSAIPNQPEQFNNLYLYLPDITM